MKFMMLGYGIEKGLNICIEKHMGITLNQA